MKSFPHLRQASLLITLVLLAGCTSNIQNDSVEVSPTELIQTETTDSVTVEEEPVVENATTEFQSTDIPQIATAYDFSAELPSEWKVEYIPAIEAINVYDPAAEGESSLEQSQLFIRYFSANTFLTLSTVTIYSQTQTDINTRPAVIYDIEKNVGIADFQDQPSWRNARHFVTDIRSTNANPAIFYVFAKRPDLDQASFDAILQSVSFEVN